MLDLNKRLDDEYLTTVTFLNEISSKYPDAIPLNSGWGDESFYNIRNNISHIELYFKHLNSSANSVGHYSNSKGIINESISKLLLKDENIKVSPESVIVTVGIQEAMALICLSTLNENGSIVVSNPCYIGLPGIAKVLGNKLFTLDNEEGGLNLTALEKLVLANISTQDKVKIVYSIPDFHNPTGKHVSLSERIALIELAYKYDFYIIEDNPYSGFNYCSNEIPTLKSIDTYDRVIYMGTFSKNIFPSIRTGFIVANQKNEIGDFYLCNAMSKVKGLLTINTSNITQAIIGGILIHNNFSLKSRNIELARAYKVKRDILLDSLHCNFPKDEEWASGVTWNKPDGGFFVIITLPFSVSKEDLYNCVSNYGVIFCPLTMFCTSSFEKFDKKIRISFSKCNAHEIREGVNRLSFFIKDHVTGMKRDIQG